MPDSVHGRLKVAIEETGLSLKAFSAACGVPYRTLQDYVAGKRYPGGENLAKIARQLRIPVDVILMGENKKDRFKEENQLYGDPQIDLIVKSLYDMDKESKADVLRYIQAQKLWKEKHLKEG